MTAANGDKDQPDLFAPPTDDDFDTYVSGDRFSGVALVVLVLGGCIVFVCGALVLMGLIP